MNARRPTPTYMFPDTNIAVPRHQHCCCDLLESQNVALKEPQIVNLGKLEAEVGWGWLLYSVMDHYGSMYQADIFGQACRSNFTAQDSGPSSLSQAAWSLSGDVQRSAIPRAARKCLVARSNEENPTKKMEMRKTTNGSRIDCSDFNA